MTFDARAFARHASPFVVVVTLLLPHAATAQGTTFARATAEVEELYDSNLFATPESAATAPLSDWITRFGPTVEAGYKSVPLRFQAHYGFEAERHQDLHDLDEVFARQDFTSVLNYRAKSLTVDVNGAFIKTQTPTELNVDTLLFLGRAPAQRANGSGAIAFDLSPVTILKIDQALSHDKIEGGVVSTSRISHAGIGRKVDPRTTLRADYRLGRVDFTNIGPSIDGVNASISGNEISHVVTGGVVHQFTPFFEVDVDAGIRSTSGDLDPEIAARVRRKVRQSEVLVRYAKTRETTIGIGPSLQVQRIDAEVSYAPTRTLSFSIRPAHARSGGTLTEDVVNVLDVESRIRAARRWTLVAAGRIGRQERTTGLNEVIPYRSISFRSIVTMGTLERQDAERETR